MQPGNPMTDLNERGSGGAAPSGSRAEPSPSFLQVQGLTVEIAGRRVVEDVSFEVARGETVALVGESGSGKSLTALSVLRLLPGGARASGRVRVGDTDVMGAGERALRGLRGGVAGMVFQEPMSSLNPLHRIGRQVGEAMALHGRRADRAAVAALLRECGFGDAEARLGAYPYELSGGQRQRVVIAMALANDPALLIADEPTTALDVTIQAQILALLDRARRERGLAMLLVTHDLGVVRRHADRVCVMAGGRIVEAGAVAEVLVRPRHATTRMLIAAEPCGRPAPVPAGAGEALAAEGLVVEFARRRGVLRRAAGSLRAVDRVDLAVRAGETVGLVGESGSGKSTIGLALLGLLPVTAGERRVAGVRLAGMDRRALRRMRADAQIVFQDPFGSLSPRMTVAGIVAEGLAVHERLGARERGERVAAALAEVGLPGDAGARFPHEFSGGQRQRIAIARAMVLKPRLVVLDEPTSALDRSVQAQIVMLLRDLQARHGLAYLFISHDLSVVRAMAHRVVVLRGGRVVEEGETEALFAGARDPYTRGLLAAALG